MVNIPDRTGVVLVDTFGVPYKVTSSGGVSQADNSAFTVNTDSGAPIEGLYEAAPTSVTDGRVGVVGITAKRVLKASLHDATGVAITTLPVSLASVPSHAVTNAGTFAVQVDGAALTSLQLIDNLVLVDDAAFTPASSSVTPVGFFVDETATDSVDEGDIGAARMTTDRLQMIVGAIAADSPLQATTYPLHIGGRASAAAPSDVSADNDAVRAWYLRNGAQAVNVTAAGALIGGSAANGLEMNLKTIAGTGAVTGSGTATGALRVELANNGTGTLSTLSTVTTVSTLTGGGIAHDSADSGNPHKMGGKAIDVGTQPTAVTANDRTDWYFNRNGVPWVLGGSPAVVSKQLNVTDADGAQTNAALVTVSAGTAIVVTAFQAMCDGANTGDVAYRVGFGTANTPSADAAGIISSHPGVKAGSGVVVGNGGGVIGMGASNEDLRVTCEDPTGGAIDFIVTYFTVLIG